MCFLHWVTVEDELTGSHRLRLLDERARRALPSPLRGPRAERRTLTPEVRSGSYGQDRGEASP